MTMKQSALILSTKSFDFAPYPKPHTIASLHSIIRGASAPPLESKEAIVIPSDEPTLETASSLPRSPSPTVRTEWHNLSQSEDPAIFASDLGKEVGKEDSDVERDIPDENGVWIPATSPTMLPTPVAVPGRLITNAPHLTWIQSIHTSPFAPPPSSQRHIQLPQCQVSAQRSSRLCHVARCESSPSPECLSSTATKRLSSVQQASPDLGGNVIPSCSASINHTVEDDDTSASAGNLSMIYGEIIVPATDGSAADKGLELEIARKTPNETQSSQAWECDQQLCLAESGREFDGNDTSRVGESPVLVNTQRLERSEATLLYPANLAARDESQDIAENSVEENEVEKEYNPLEGAEMEVPPLVDIDEHELAFQIAQSCGLVEERAELTQTEVLKGTTSNMNESVSVAENEQHTAQVRHGYALRPSTPKPLRKIPFFSPDLCCGATAATDESVMTSGSDAMPSAWKQSDAMLSHDHCCRGRQDASAGNRARANSKVRRSAILDPLDLRPDNMRDPASHALSSSRKRQLGAEGYSFTAKKQKPSIEVAPNSIERVISPPPRSNHAASEPQQPHKPRSYIPHPFTDSSRHRRMITPGPKPQWRGQSHSTITSSTTAVAEACRKQEYQRTGRFYFKRGTDLDEYKVPPKNDQVVRPGTDAWACRDGFTQWEVWNLTHGSSKAKWKPGMGVLPI